MINYYSHVLISYCFSYILIEESNCIAGFVSKETIQLLSPQIRSLKLPTQELRLFPDIKFNKHGYVTKWVVGGKTSDKSSTNDITTELQIWRVNSTEISTYTRVAAYKLNESSSMDVSDNVREYLVNPPISVEAEDIIGIFQPSSSSVNVYFQECNGPNNVIIQEYDNDTGPTTVEKSATSNINDYPLIAVNVSKPDNDSDASPLSNNSREDEMLNKQMK